MSYKELGARKKTGIPDRTGNNTGKWTVTFAPEDIATRFQYFEVYKVIVHGAPGSSLKWFVDNNLWESTLAADDNAWDPAQPLLLRQGENIYFYWSDSTADGLAPTVTLWMRYDPEIPGNRGR